MAKVFSELAGRIPDSQRGWEGYEMPESKIVNEWIRQCEVRGRLSVSRRTTLRIPERKFPGLVPEEIGIAINHE